jgi:prevent-host-death family protein
MLLYDHRLITMDIPMFKANQQATISAGDFKAQCLALMDNVKNKRQTIVITKRGVPVAKLVPVDEAKPSLFGWMEGTLIEKGNIIDPIECIWEADL